MSGSLVTSTATFTNTSGTPTDPTTITLKVQSPNGTVNTYTYPNAFITRVSTGVYSAEIDTTGLTGYHGPITETFVVEWIGTGNVQAINSTSWPVTPAPL